MNLVEHEIDAASEETSPLRIIKKDKHGNLNNYAVPREIIDKYKKKIKDQGFDSKIKGKDEICLNLPDNCCSIVLKAKKGVTLWRKSRL